MLYFAYGSNMSTPRLHVRVPSAMPVEVAELVEYRLAFHKAGRDGSAKCDALFTGAPGDVVIGVVFRIAEHEKPMLDEVEGLGCGYREAQVGLTSRSGKRVTAFTYCATNIDDTLRPFDWYRQHVLHGAREHGLPADYVRCIETVEADPDPDAARRVWEMAIYNQPRRLKYQ